MKVFGWTMEQIETAVSRAADKVGLGTRFKVYYNNIQRSRKWGEIHSLTIGMYSPSARLKDGGYPPGVGVLMAGIKTERRIDPIPFGELDKVRSIIPAKYNKITTYRSTGHLCFHSFGKIFRELFEINPSFYNLTSGKIVTAMYNYTSKDSLTNAWSKARREDCRCEQYGVDNF